MEIFAKAGDIRYFYEYKKASRRINSLHNSHVYLKTLLIISISLTSITAYTQNLIPNPSFEEMLDCPSNHTTTYDPIKTKDWYSPSRGTPDLFSSCSLFPKVSTPRNFTGTAYPPDGGNYVGMYFGSPKHSNKWDYREYLTCRLLEQLKKGKEYQFRFYARPATYNGYLIDRFSFLFTSDSVLANHDQLLSDVDFQTILVDTLEEHNDWYVIDLIFKATGNEEFLTIGDFIPPGQANIEKMSVDSKMKEDDDASYYLFDSFSLEEIVAEPEPYLIEKPFSVENIYFEFDSYELNDSSFQELSTLAEYLKRNDDLLLVIYGNTDKSGSDNYNNELSLKRAISVMDAMIELGVKSGRLEAFGNGERGALSQFDSLNRKTEFLLLPKKMDASSK